jgi:hypothetical protein
VDPDLEAPQQALALAPRREIRAGVLEMAEHRPEQFFGKLRAALLVGVGETVPGRRRDTETCQDSGFEPKPVTDIVDVRWRGRVGRRASPKDGSPR